MSGDSSEPDNPFSWDKVRLNLPGDKKIPPHNPLDINILRGKSRDRQKLHTYVDDSGVSAGS